MQEAASDGTEHLNVNTKWAKQDQLSTGGTKTQDTWMKRRRGWKKI